MLNASRNEECLAVIIVTYFFKYFYFHDTDENSTREVFILNERIFLGQSQGNFYFISIDRSEVCM